MTLLFMDGFNHYDTNYLTKKGWTINSGTPIIDPTGGEKGNGCIKCDYADELRYNLGDSTDKITVGFATRWDAMPNSSLRTMFRANNDTGGSYVMLYAGDDGHVELWNTGKLYDSGAGFFTTGAWYYIEIQIYFYDGSAGHISMQWNGNLKFSQDADNISTGSAVYNHFYLEGSANGVQRYNHVYILDDNGTENNDYLGPIRVDTIYPNAAGNYTQMDSVKATSINNYEAVNETSLEEGDYVHGDANGEKDSYQFQSLPSTVFSDIKGIQINYSAEKRTPNTVQARSLIRKGSTDYFGTAKTLSQGVQNIERQIQETDPSDSSKWSKSKVEACEFGVDTVI